jgi:uncharacterized protein with PIN domain
MDTAIFHFFGELNFFLPKSHRYQPFTHAFTWKASIKDMVESLGPPHCEIDLLMVNGVSVGFDHIVMPKSHICVYDHATAITVDERVLLRSPLYGKPRFVLDTHLGRLASYLRMMGFDTLYRNDYPDDVLAEISDLDGRVLLTRDIGLLKRGRVQHGYFIRATNPKQQIVEIIRRYNLSASITPFRRCLKCNGELTSVEKADVLSQLPNTSAEQYDEFHQCDVCGQVYWKGTHYDKMCEFLEGVMKG